MTRENKIPREHFEARPGEQRTGNGNQSGKRKNEREHVLTAWQANRKWVKMQRGESIFIAVSRITSELHSCALARRLTILIGCPPIPSRLLWSRKPFWLVAHSYPSRHLWSGQRCVFCKFTSHYLSVLVPETRIEITKKQQLENRTIHFIICTQMKRIGAKSKCERINSRREMTTKGNVWPSSDSEPWFEWKRQRETVIE